ncbi:Response regulatory protein [Desulfovibrio sp. DV]|uniref:PEP-CTERM-box response regulator transcription factor n=1 Tax=Desulfovibrio sp. DV TaxID=1844708 RepID=UPI00094B9F69|nr:PEP-CTERM-box response regulator transcription factor [Desulfovibrio sp. DV]OLN29434.1 Response regulatory protein [Desulfovibrio sp. DV]
MAPADTLLVIDDNDDIRQQLKWALSKAGYVIHFAKDAKEGLERFRKHAPGVVTLDLGLPPCTGDASQGLACLSEMVAVDPNAKIIVITGFDEQKNARLAVDIGAYDFFRKPIDLVDLQVMIRRAFALARIEREAAPDAKTVEQPEHGMIGESPGMRRVFAMISKVAASDVPVLINGESGTGKELVARALHRYSRRRERALVCVNCGAIPENLLESEFFGHERGAFTGAHSTCRGKVEDADKGTLFLDEIGEMPLNLQVKLLRFLQEMSFNRVGGRKLIEVDVRVLTATNVNIEEAMRRGQFRDDLYYRIGVVTISLPALRHRGNDILLLARHFLALHGGGMGKDTKGLTPQAEACLMEHSWPGNVRELDNKVRRAIILAGDSCITPAHLGFEGHPDTAEPISEQPSGSLREARSRLENRMVIDALKQCEGNILKASEALGVSRPTLYELMRKHGITPNAV